MDKATRAMPGISLLPEVVSTDVDGDAYLLHVETGVYLRTTGPGTVIVDLLAEPVGTAEIIARLQQDYDVGFEEAEKAVTAFVADLRSHGMIAEG